VGVDLVLLVLGQGCPSLGVTRGRRRALMDQEHVLHGVLLRGCMIVPRRMGRVGIDSSVYRAPMDVVLVHSPLVGPGTWGPVAAELGRRGRLVAVPVLGPDALPDWRPWIDEVCRIVCAMPGRVMVAGHSGGGILLPLVATEAKDDVGCLLFVDSDVP